MKKTAHKHPYQPYSRKDSQRIESLVQKAVRAADKRHADSWSYENQEAFNEEAAKLAHRMARTIKDWKKAGRRGAAAENENFHDVARIFFDRADELWIQAGSPGKQASFKGRLRRILAEEKLARRQDRQQPEAKDLARARKMVDRAMKKTRLHDPQRDDFKLFMSYLLDEARRQARTIKDWAKAERRGSAVLKSGWDAGWDYGPAAKVFFDRADSLDRPTATPEPDWSGGRANRFYVIPMGAVNLRNGNNREFNFIQTWGGEMTTLLIAERSKYEFASGKPRRIILVGSGDGGYARPGEVISLEGDQTMRDMGVAVTVGEVVGPMDEDLLQRAARMIGKSSALAYVMK